MRAVVVAIRYLEEELAELTGLDLNEAMALCCLVDEEVPSTTSKILASLEGYGLVQRRIGEDDRRKIFYQLTPQGEDRVADLRSLDLDFGPIHKALS